MAQFLYRNMVTAYNTEVALTSGTALDYSKPIRVMDGKPDDPEVIRKAPVIAISRIASSGRDREYEIGSNRLWRTRNFLFSCYPAIDSNGQPCTVAAELLRSYMQNVFETEFIRIVDYSNVACTSSNILFCSDVMYIDHVVPPEDRGRSSVLAEEKHRFDVHVGVKYVVIAPLIT